jgi:hypothetical protein
MITPTLRADAAPAIAPLLPGTLIRLLQAGDDEPRLAHGTVTDADGLQLCAELDGASPFSSGTRVLVSPREGAPTRHAAVVAEVEGNLVTLHLVPAPPPDRREYPRLNGRLPLRYRLAADAADQGAWLAGGPLGADIRTPSPWMEFSATGLLFEDTAPPAAGSILLLELGVPDDPRRWRCTGRVIRILPASTPGAGRVALQLEDVPVEATIALADYTLDMQEAMLLGDDGALDMDGD